MCNINPLKILGNNWTGYALDIHTESSEYLGENEYGRPRFDTKRSEIGELLYKLKYHGDISALDEIAETVIHFLSKDWCIVDELNYIIPVPPSNIDRQIQPVIEIAKKLCEKLSIPLCEDALVKIKETPELKDIIGFGERKEVLKDAYCIRNQCIREKRVLLIDDLFRSGATINHLANILYNIGKVKSLYVVTLTKTRKNR